MCVWVPFASLGRYLLNTNNVHRQKKDKRAKPTNKKKSIKPKHYIFFGSFFHRYLRNKKQIVSLLAICELFFRVCVCAFCVLFGISIAFSRRSVNDWKRTPVLLPTSYRLSGRGWGVLCDKQTVAFAERRVICANRSTMTSNDREEGTGKSHTIPQWTFVPKVKQKPSFNQCHL